MHDIQALVGGLDPKTIKKFWSRVNIKGPDECWPWIGPGVYDNHGQPAAVTSLGSVSAKIARWAYALTKGGLQPGFVVMHECDNPLCCNPDHLIQATQGENMKDMARKGRAWKGGPRRPYSDEDKQQIFDMFLNEKPRPSFLEMSRRLGRSDGTVISKILQRTGHYTSRYEYPEQVQYLEAAE